MAQIFTPGGKPIDGDSSPSTEDQPQFRPREIDDNALVKLDHVEWLENFSKMVNATTARAGASGSEAQRIGMATRLMWAARYIRLLRGLLLEQEAEVEKLKRQLAEPPYGDALEDPSGR